MSKLTFLVWIFGGGGVFAGYALEDPYSMALGAFLVISFLLWDIAEHLKDIKDFKIK